MKQELFDYNDIFFEQETLLLEMENLSNDALLDECNHILSSNFHSKIMDDILVSYFRNGKISKEQRKIAEGLYVLAHGELAWEV